MRELWQRATAPRTSEQQQHSSTAITSIPESLLVPLPSSLGAHSSEHGAGDAAERPAAGRPSLRQVRLSLLQQCGVAVRAPLVPCGRRRDSLNEEDFYHSLLLLLAGSQRARPRRSGGPSATAASCCTRAGACSLARPFSGGEARQAAPLRTRCWRSSPARSSSRRSACRCLCATSGAASRRSARRSGLGSLSRPKARSVCTAAPPPPPHAHAHSR